jgi:hypothetical protein
MLRIINSGQCLLTDPVILGTFSRLLSRCREREIRAQPDTEGETGLQLNHGRAPSLPGHHCMDSVYQTPQ